MDIIKWKNNIIETVEYLANKDKQKKGWFELCEYSSSPDELYCFLFEDEDIEDFLNLDNNDLTEHQIQSGNELVRHMNLYGEKHPEALDPKVVIQDPEWDKVIEAAKRFHQALTVNLSQCKN